MSAPSRTSEAERATVGHSRPLPQREEEAVFTEAPSPHHRGDRVAIVVPRTSGGVATPDPDPCSDTASVTSASSSTQLRRPGRGGRPQGGERATHAEETQRHGDGEAEGWGRWLSRLVYNTALSFSTAAYAAGQAARFRRPEDNVIDHNAKQYWEAPPPPARPRREVEDEEAMGALAAGDWREDGQQQQDEAVLRTNPLQQPPDNPLHDVK